jgi:hypothetical protein
MMRSLLVFLLLGTNAAYAQQTSPPVATPNGVQSAAQVGQAAPPRCDVNCVKSNAQRASEVCAPRIEAQAPSDFDWLTRPSPGIFQQADASSPADSVVRFRGDSVRFMDAQKSWVRVSYECGYDVDSQTVTYVNVRAGRLDQPATLSQRANTTPPATTAAPTAAAAASQQTAAAPRPRPRVGEPSPVEIQQQSPNPKRP